MELASLISFVTGIIFCFSYGAWCLLCCLNLYLSKCLCTIYLCPASWVPAWLLKFSREFSHHNILNTMYGIKLCIVFNCIWIFPRLDWYECGQPECTQYEIQFVQLVGLVLQSFSLYWSKAFRLLRVKWMVSLVCLMSIHLIEIFQNLRSVTL